jgi:hypothetical protein
MTIPNEEPPTVVATRTHLGGLRIQCPHCGRAHLHGGDPGHRIAHCAPQTEGGWRLGYYITLRCET